MGLPILLESDPMLHEEPLNTSPLQPDQYNLATEHKPWPQFTFL